MLALIVLLAGPPDAILQPPKAPVTIAPRVAAQAQQRAPHFDRRTGVAVKNVRGSRFRLTGEVTRSTDAALHVKTRRGVVELRLPGRADLAAGDRVEVRRTPARAAGRVGYRVQVRRGDDVYVDSGVVPAGEVDLGGGVGLRQLPHRREPISRGDTGRLFPAPVQLHWRGGQADVVPGEETLVAAAGVRWRIQLAASTFLRLNEQRSGPVEGWGPTLVYTAIRVGPVPGRP